VPSLRHRQKVPSAILMPNRIGGSEIVAKGFHGAAAET
jgi:hypothetical protein